MLAKNLRDYELYLKEAKGLSEKTIDSKFASLDIISDVYKGDIRKLSPKKLVKIKQNLHDFNYNGKIITLKQIRRILNDFSQYLVWLSQKSGYKSKISLNLISYLSLSNEEMAKTYITERRDFPLLDYVVKLCKSININNIIDERDVVIIAFLMLFGIRNMSLCTLTLGSIDRVTLELRQSPLEGVKTKFTKYIYTFCFMFDDYLVEIVRRWIDRLYSIGYSQSDPLFPKSAFVGNVNGAFGKRTQLSMEFMRSKSTLNSILKHRAEACGFKYYSAHCFRHSCAYHALKCVENAHQLKAVSQQFSHNTIALVLTTYGNLSTFQQREVIESMNFNFKNKFGL